MIRTRLAAAFALVALLALSQAFFAWWAASTAAYHADRSVVATKLLAEYLELAGNKQRLKVWFAQRMLTGDADPAVRDGLTLAMKTSVADLGLLAQRLSESEARFEQAEIATVARNVATLEQAVRDVERPQPVKPPGEQWRAVLRDFDELSGRDMRELLAQAVTRQERASADESAQLAKALARVRTTHLLLAGSVLLAAIAAVVYFLRRLDQPFARLTRQSAALAGGDLDARSGLAGRDEFATIGGLLDTMAARLAQAQARSAGMQQGLEELVGERTRALSQAHESLLGIETRRRQFFAALSHELRTPVTVIRGEAELALRKPGDADEQRAVLQRIVAAAGELGGRVHDLFDAARSGRVEYAYTLEPCLPLDAVRSAVEQMQTVAQHRGVALEFTAGIPPGEVRIDRERFQQALVVVLDNALRYSPAGTTVHVKLCEEDGHCLVHVEDEGPGMSAQELERAFEPQFRGRAARDLDRHGQGLGLSIARGILEGLDGSIELERRAPRGMRATLAVPLLQRTEAHS